MNLFLEYLKNNKEWLFDGLGITSLSIIFWILKQSISSFGNAKKGSFDKSVTGQIKILGPRNSGKTVYLATLADWHNLGNESPIYSITPLSEYAQILICIAQDILKQGAEVAPTHSSEIEEIPNYTFKIKVVFNPYYWFLYFFLRKHIEFNLSFNDYCGEFFQEMSNENQINSSIHSILNSYLDDCALSSGIMILIDSLGDDKNDLMYARALINLEKELDYRLKKGNRSLSNYRIAIVH